MLHIITMCVGVGWALGPICVTRFVPPNYVLIGLMGTNNGHWVPHSYRTRIRGIMGIIIIE